MEQNQHRHIRTVLRSMRSDARAIFTAGLAAVDPVRAVHEHCRLDSDTLHIDPRSYALNTIDRVVVVGAGKAATNDLVLVLLSGGGSALLPYPADSISRAKPATLPECMVPWPGKYWPVQTRFQPQPACCQGAKQP